MEEDFSDYGPVSLGHSTLVIKGRELMNITEDAGAHLNVVDNDSLSGASDDEEPDEGFQEITEFSKTPLNHGVNSELIRKELISVVLNANKDPRELDIRGTNLLSASALDTEAVYEKLQKRYSKLASYSALIDSESNKTYKELSKDVLKKTLTPGSGLAVKEDSFVFFHAAFWSEGVSDPFDSSWRRRKVFMIDLSKEFVIPGLMTILISMKKNELCEGLIMDPNLGYGRLGCPPRIPANAKLFCLVEMVKVLHRDKLSKFTIDLSAAQGSGVTFNEFYVAANQARQRGNHFYDCKLYKVALDRYRSGIRILHGFTYKDEAQENQAKALLMKLYNNSAKCLNELKRPRISLSICRMAEDIDKTDPKLNYNYIKAWQIKGNTDLALGRCRYALQVISDNKTRKVFEVLADELKRKLEAEYEDSKRLHRLMGESLLAK